MKEMLDCDNWISWRRRSEDFALTLDDGDPVVVTISPNGHDAAASILSRPGECKHVSLRKIGSPLKALEQKVSFITKLTLRMKRSPKKTGIRGHVKEISLDSVKISEKAQ